MKSHINLLLILFILIINNTYAGEVELQLEIDIPDTTNLEYGQIISFSVTVDNLGSDDAGGDSIASLPNSVFINDIIQDSEGELELLFGNDTSIDQECLFFLITGDPLPPPFPQHPPLDYVINLPVIPANSSITCFGNVIVNITQDRIVHFNVVANIDDTETNLDNNSIDVLFALKPRTIPINDSFSLITLILTLILIGQLYFRKNKR